MAIKSKQISDFEFEKLTDGPGAYSGHARELIAVDAGETGLEFLDQFSSILKGPAGSAAAPTYSFFGDPNTGVYSSAADVLGFSAGGVEQLTLSTTQTVFNSAYADVDFIIRSNAYESVKIDGDTDAITLYSGKTRLRTNEYGWTAGDVATQTLASDWRMQAFEVVNDSSHAYLAAISTQDATGPNRGTGHLYLATLRPSDPVSSDSILGRIHFAGTDLDGDQFRDGAEIAAYADGAATSNGIPTRIVYSLHNGSTKVNPLTIKSSQVQVRGSLVGVVDDDTGLTWGVGANLLTVKTGGVTAAYFTSTQQLQGTNGTVALPTFSFISDPDTGIYRSAGNAIGFACAGAKVLDIATTGLGVTGYASTTTGLVIAETADHPIAPAATKGQFWVKSDTPCVPMFTDDAGVDFQIGGAGFVPAWPLLAPDGAVGAPSYSFANDTNSGVYRIGSDVIGVSCGGAKIAEFYGGAGVVAYNRFYAQSFGTEAGPAFTWNTSTSYGMYQISTPVADQGLGFSVYGKRIFNVNWAGCVIASQVANDYAGLNPTLSVTSAAHTLIRAGEYNNALFDFSQVHQFETGAIALQRTFRIAAPTYAFVGASTITDAATLYIDGPPVAGTNATITKAYAAWIGGDTRVDGLIFTGDGAVGTPAWTFLSDPDTGVYSIGADSIGLCAGGVLGITVAEVSSAANLGFFSASAIAQPSSTGETTGFTAGSGTGVNDDSTFTGNVGSTAYRLSDIVKHLKNLGLIAS